MKWIVFARPLGALEPISITKQVVQLDEHNRRAGDVSPLFRYPEIQHSWSRRSISGRLQSAKKQWVNTHARPVYTSRPVTDCGSD